MRRVRLAAVSLLSLLVALPAFSQPAPLEDLADSLDAFVTGALRVNIQARIIDPAQSDEVWTMDITRITIGGRSVRVRMEGANIVVIADFTPYWETEEELLLLAQGQTWVTDYHGSGEVIHRTSFTTMPIRLGEPIVFLPLGSTPRDNLDTEQVGLLSIELEINVERYQS